MDEAARRRARRLRAPVLLGLAALPQVLGGIAEAARGRPEGLLLAACGLLAVVAMTAIGRRAPGPAVAVVGAAELVALLVQPLPPVALLPAAVAIAIAGARGAVRWAAGVAAALVLLPIVRLSLAGSATEAAQAGRALGASMLLLLALGAGAFARARRRVRAEAVARAADRQRIAVEQERVRIARELHDVLAHSLSSIAVQAGVGLHLAPERPEAATEALTAIRDASRTALDEVRGVLGVLRGDDDAPRAPEPDLDALAPLVDRLRRGGARIDLDDALQPRPARPAQLALFRIVQESLTNARRHAPGAAIRVVLERDGDADVARIRDVRPGAAPAQPHAGNGILGMRERAAQLGGSVEILRHDDGVEVVARLPEPVRS